MSSVAPDAAEAVRERRAGAEAAAVRLTLANRRAAWSERGLRAEGRAAGRIAEAIPALPLADAGDAVLLPIVDPARGERIIAAAAAALAGNSVLRAITADDRAAADALVVPEARAFAVRHRHLALPPGDVSLAEALSRARGLAAAAWRERLPAVLAAECPDHPAPPSAALLPADEMSPAPAPPGPAEPQGAPARAAVALRGALRALRRRRPVVAPVAVFVPVALRPAEAVSLALAEIAAAPKEQA